MRYGNIKRSDIANGPGVRISVFVSGCRNHCPGCFQPETWDFNYGKLFTTNVARAVVADLNYPYYQGLSILGGEPMEPENQRGVYELVEMTRICAEGRDIWLYSGYTLEELLSEARLQTEYTRKILDLIDVLVDGRFEEDKKDISLIFRGSSNQRIIDMNETMLDPSVIKFHPIYYKRSGGDAKSVGREIAEVALGENADEEKKEKFAEFYELYSLGKTVSNT